MNISYNIIQKIVDKRGLYIDEYASEYGEPGYFSKKPILFANWNSFPAHIMHYLEKHYELEWSDEWVISYETGRAYRSSPDCYGWQPYFWINHDCEVIGGDEIQKEKYLRERYIEAYLNDPKKAIHLNIDLAKEGFQKYNGTFENGFHPGQDDNPEEITKTIRSGRRDGHTMGIISLAMDKAAEAIVKAKGKGE